MRLTLVIPNLLAHEREALAAVPALTVLARYAAPAILQTDGLSGALFAANGMPGDTAPAPVAALGAGLDVGERFVLYADPVSLVAGRDNVTLAGRVNDLNNAECLALIATLNAHFASDGLQFCAPRVDAWFVTLPTAPDLATTPLGRVRGSLYPHLPQGTDGPTWRRWISEMQMLLHDHPVNAAREAAGNIPVTGIWISGGGVMPPPLPETAWRTLAAATQEGDVARGIAKLAGRVAAPVPMLFAPNRQGRDILAVLSAVRAARDIEAADRAWLAPAIAALVHGDLAELTLVADGDGRAAIWRAPRPSLVARARAFFDARAFDPPALPDDDEVR